MSKNCFGTGLILSKSIFDFNKSYSSGRDDFNGSKIIKNGPVVRPQCLFKVLQRLFIFVYKSKQTLWNLKRHCGRTTGLFWMISPSLESVWPEGQNLLKPKI